MTDLTYVSPWAATKYILATPYYASRGVQSISLYHVRKMWPNETFTGSSELAVDFAAATFSYVTPEQLLRPDFEVPQPKPMHRIHPDDFRPYLQALLTVREEITIKRLARLISVPPTRAADLLNMRGVANPFFTHAQASLLYTSLKFDMSVFDGLSRVRTVFNRERWDV